MTGARESRAVHPHGRGDNFLHAGYHVTYSRFTPTGVGTISSVRVSTDTDTVHPHGRGDNRLRFRYQRNMNGSPPRAWGQYERHHAGGHVDRFTPTGVGTIAGLFPWRNGGTVHPHGRGDNVQVRVGNGVPSGSPPRAWGQYGQEDGDGD